MNNIKDLREFVLAGIEDETSYPERLSLDATMFDLIDSMGTVGLFCDIEQNFCEVGFEIPDHVITVCMERTTTVESFCDFIADYLLNNITDDEIGPDTVYERKHNLW